ncbi:hypothetical protein LTS18_009569, partial [Coniosporium uncinatum]
MPNPWAKEPTSMVTVLTVPAALRTRDAGQHTLNSPDAAVSAVSSAEKFVSAEKADDKWNPDLGSTKI